LIKPKTNEMTHHVQQVMISRTSVRMPTLPGHDQVLADIKLTTVFGSFGNNFG